MKHHYCLYRDAAGLLPGREGCVVQESIITAVPAESLMWVHMWGGNQQCNTAALQMAFFWDCKRIGDAKSKLGCCVLWFSLFPVVFCCWCIQSNLNRLKNWFSGLNYFPVAWFFFLCVNPLIPDAHKTRFKQNIFWSHWMWVKVTPYCEKIFQPFRWLSRSLFTRR